MSQKHNSQSDSDNVESLAHDLLGIDLNAGDDSDEPLEVDGLGLDDLGFGPPPATASSTEPATAPSNDEEDPLAWIVKGASASLTSVRAESRSNPVIDDWDDDDDFGSGLIDDDDDDYPVASSAKSSAFSDDLEEDDEPEFEAVSAVEDEEEEIDEPASPAVKDDYWDALEGWDQWDENPPAKKSTSAESSAETRGGQDRGPRRGRGRGRGRNSGPARVEQPIVESSDELEEDTSWHAEAPSEVPARPQRSERPSRQRQRQGRNDRAIEGDDRESVSRERSGNPRKEKDAERVSPPSSRQREVAEVDSERDDEASSGQGRRRGRGRGRGRGDKSTKVDVAAAVPEADRKKSEDLREERPRKGRRPQPVVEAVDEEIADDDFGAGILGGAPPAPTRRERPARAERPSRRQPVIEEDDDDFGSGIDDDFDDDFGVEEAPSSRRAASSRYQDEEEDDFGADLNVEPEPVEQRHRRAPRRRRAVAPETVETRPEPVSGRGQTRSRRQESAVEKPVETPPPAPKYEDIPTWEHAISLLVKKSGRSSGSRRGGGGQGRSSGGRRGGQRSGGSDYSRHD